MARVKSGQIIFAAILAIFVYGMIAAMLGTPVGTIKWRISEARRLLKHKLAAVGFEHE